MAYLNDPRQPMPAYLPVFVRPALSQWSHAALQQEGFAMVLDFYQLKEKPPFGLLLIVDGYDECQIGDAPIAQLSWDTETHAKYQADLEKATNIRTVLRNPFVLHLFVQSFATLKDKNFQQLNRWQIYESAVEEWLHTHQGLLSQVVQQKLTGSQTDHIQLVKSFAAFASQVAFTTFQQGKIVLGQADVAKLNSPWGRISDEVKQDGQETFQGYRLSLRTIHKKTPLLLVEKLNYLERIKKKLTLPILIEWQTPEEGTTYFVYGLAANSKPQLTPLPEVSPAGLVFKNGGKLFVSAQQHPTLYQAITETKAHVKSADRRSLLSEADYLTILVERCQQFSGVQPRWRTDGDR